MKRINLSDDDSNEFIDVSSAVWGQAVDRAVEQGTSPQDTLAEIISDTDNWVSVE